MNSALCLLNALAVVALVTFQLQSANDEDIAVIYPHMQIVMKPQLAVMNATSAQRPIMTNQPSYAQPLLAEQTERFTF
ncbi:hypothetical protein NVV94_07325 [Pseudomonas sp. LS1212]|uniref:hypothetical protein n=1 Tax=Pseudomonas sp. LS1212 TaxID=2972478 RepID=UPI00215BE7D9|nr:hypothetical protein [Pseudomonas sp. LS1212]UVJ45372.1 hypothetical protein NVV94_07325 [Pseudomonas sp. LS1212]